jgi:hypothetical protein
MASVFISYSQDSDAHKARVSAFVQRLKSDGLDVAFDQDVPPGGPPEDWNVWSEGQVTAGGKVLMVFTERYYARYLSKEAPGVGCGATFEARIIRQILIQASFINNRFRVVLLSSADDQYVPYELRAFQRYNIESPTSYQELLAWVKDEPVAISSPSIPAPAPVVWPALTAPYEWSIADRQNIFSVLVEMLNGQSRQRYLLLSAGGNVGKTWTLGEMNAYAQHHSIASAYIDLKGCAELHVIFDSLRSALGPAILRRLDGAHGTAQTSCLIEDLRRQTKPVLLIFDTYEQATDEVRRLLESLVLLRLADAPAVVVVIAGREVPDHNKYLWRNVAQHLPLGPIDEPSHWREYVRRRWQCDLPPGWVEGLIAGGISAPGTIHPCLENMVALHRPAAGA